MVRHLMHTEHSRMLQTYLWK